MLKSNLNTYQATTGDALEIVPKVLQATIYNAGNVPFYFRLQEVPPKGLYRIDPSGSFFDLDLVKHLKFTGSLTAEQTASNTTAQHLAIINVQQLNDECK